MRLINQHEDYLGMRCCEFLRYEPGTNKLITSTDLSGTTLDVRSVLPPTMKQGKSEFVDGLLLFAVAGNHLVLMQSQSLRARELEDYLNWLLKKQGVMPESENLYLVDQPQARIQQRVDASRVRSAAFRLPIVVADRRTATQNIKRNEHVEVIKEGVGASLLRTLFGPTIFNKLPPEKLGDSKLRLDIKLTYERSTDADGERLIKNVTRALRHVDLPDEDVTIDLPSIGVLKGSELKLTHTESITVDRGIPDRTEVFKKMNDWLVNLSKNQLIE